MISPFSIDGIVQVKVFPSIVLFEKLTVFPVLEVAVMLAGSNVRAVPEIVSVTTTLVLLPLEVTVAV